MDDSGQVIVDSWIIMDKPLVIHDHTVDDCEILHQLGTIGKHKTLQIVRLLDWIHHLPPGAGFLPPTV